MLTERLNHASLPPTSVAATGKDDSCVCAIKELSRLETQ